MADLAHDLMHRCIRCSGTQQRRVEVQALVKIIRALPTRLLMDEVALCHGPWCGEKVLDGGEERLRESPERIGMRDAGLHHPPQGACFLRGNAHSLSVRRIESADHIAERYQIVRKPVERLKAP